MRLQLFDTGADIKVMETEAFRQQKADEQASTEQQPQEPFMSFSPDEAAAARNAAAQEAAQRKAGGAPAPPDQAASVPPSQPAKTLTPKEAAAAALQKIRHEIDDLAKQVLSSADLALCSILGETNSACARPISRPTFTEQECMPGCCALLCC